MGRTLSKEDGQALDDLLLQDPNTELKGLAILFRCHYTTVQRRRKKIRDGIRDGIYTPKPRKKVGRPKKMVQEIEDYVADLTGRAPNTSLDEITVELYVQFGIQISASTASRMRQRLRKQTQPALAAGQQNEDSLEAVRSPA